MTHSSIRTAYERVQTAVAHPALWRWPHAQIRAASCWMDLMLAELRDPDTTLAPLDDDQRVLVHDTFDEVLALAHALRAGDDAPELRVAVDALVDAFAPMLR